MRGHTYMNEWMIWWIQIISMKCNIFPIFMLGMNLGVWRWHWKALLKQLNMLFDDIKYKLRIFLSNFHYKCECSDIYLYSILGVALTSAKILKLAC